MADIIQTVQFKRGTLDNLTLVLKGDNKPAAGEPILEFVKDATDGHYLSTKFKIGDGVLNYEDLPYITTGGSSSSDIYILGYLLNGKFYTDSTYTTECEKNNQKIYINQNGSAASANGLIDCYRYWGDLYGFKPLVSEATDLKPGLVKLYKEHGVNEDGTMTQKAITNGVDDIKFSVETVADEDGDGEAENVLVLSKPW